MKLVAALSAAISVLGTEIPVLANGFSSTIEAVIDNKDYSIVLSEVYDSENDRLRIDRRDKNGTSMATEICDMQHNHHFKISHSESGTVCEESSAMECLRMTQGQRHLTRASEMLERLNASNPYTDGGAKRARGMMCDTWLSEGNLMTSTRRPTISITYDIEWFFQANTWNRGADAAHSIPVLALLNGTHTNTSSGETSGFKHHYNFLDFHPDFASTSLGAQHFAIRPEWNCAGHAALSCGEGTVERNGSCVCGTEAASGAGRRVLNTVYDTASSGFGFLPLGLVAGYFFYGAH